MPSHSRRIHLKALTAVAALVATSMVWSGGTFSAFNQTSSMPSNSVTAGTVAVGDNDGGSAVMTLAGATPGSTTSGCVVVSYTGTAPAQLRLYGTAGGTGLAAYLTLTVTRGTIPGTPTAGSCTGFTADSTAWAGAGAGVVYSGLLSAYPTTSGTAINDPSTASVATWNSGDKHAYKLTLTLPSNAASGAQGLTASAGFTWQGVST